MIRTYSLILKEMKQRKIIRSKNVVADIGEQLVVNTYNKKPKFPKLQLAPEGTQNVDALSRNGERYSIKTTTLPNRSTGVFYGLEGIGSKKENTKNLEHASAAQPNCDHSASGSMPNSRDFHTTGSLWVRRRQSTRWLGRLCLWGSPAQ